MTNLTFTRIKDENILPEFEGCLVEVDEASERNCGAEEDDPASKKSVLMQQYVNATICSNTEARHINSFIMFS